MQQSIQSPSEVRYSLEFKNYFCILNNLSYDQIAWLSKSLTWDEKSYTGDYLKTNTLFFQGMESSHYTFSGIIKYWHQKGLFKNVYSQTFPQQIELESHSFGKFKLREYQIGTVSVALSHKHGAIQMGTGGGKAICIASIVSILMQQKENTATIVVPTVYLAFQLKCDLIDASIPEESIGLFGGGEYPSGNFRVLIAVVNSLSQEILNNHYPNRTPINEVPVKSMVYLLQQQPPTFILNFLRNTTALITDEVHHNSAASYILISLYTRPEYFLGFTGTFFEDEDNPLSNYEDALLLGLYGPPIVNISQKYLRDNGYLSEPIILLENNSQPSLSVQPTFYSAVEKKFIFKNKDRNDRIIKATNKFIELDIPTLILVKNKNHALDLLDSFKGKPVIVIFGNEVAHLYDEYNQCQEVKFDFNLFKTNFRDGHYKIIIATQVFDEGVDLPEIGAVILSGAGKSMRRIQQRIGRALRLKKNSKHTYIVDFTDRTHVFLFSQFKKRRALYERMEIPIVTNKEQFWIRVEQLRRQSVTA